MFSSGNSFPVRSSGGGSHLMKERLKQLASSERGVEMVEYAVIMGLVVVASLTVIVAIGIWVKKQYADFKTVSGA
jgi:Flp pilus assembly pilin Flp